jgi:hypothetical protein
MTNLPAAAGRRPLFDTARDRLVGKATTATVVTCLGASLAVPHAVERAARCPGAASG